MDADTILNSIDAAAYAKDLDGNYTYANAMVQRVFGADLAGIIGKDDSHFFDLEKSNPLRDASGTIVGMCGLSIDITNRG